MNDNCNNKEITKTWISGKKSCTLVIPKKLVKEFGLEPPTHVILEKHPHGILIRKLELI
jgi:hypothetical protein